MVDEWVISLSAEVATHVVERSVPKHSAGEFFLFDEVASDVKCVFIFISNPLARRRAVCKHRFHIRVLDTGPPGCDLLTNLIVCQETGFTCIGTSCCRTRRWRAGSERVPRDFERPAVSWKSENQLLAKMIIWA